MRRDMPRLLVHTSRRGGPKNDDALRVRRCKVRVSKVTRLEAYEPDPDDPEDQENDYAFTEVSEWEEVSRDDEKVVTRGKTAMRQKGYGKGYERKEFGENLKPLARFLQKQVGRPWDKVYAEIRDVCEPTGTVNAHIYAHLWDFVIKDVFIGPDGKPWQKAGAKYGSESPLTASPGSWWHALYVHPVTGLLCKVPTRKYKRWSQTQHVLDLREDCVVLLRAAHAAKNGVRTEPLAWLSKPDPTTGVTLWFAIHLAHDGKPSWGSGKPKIEDLVGSLTGRGFDSQGSDLVVREFYRVGKETWTAGTEVRVHGPVPHASVGVDAKREKAA